MKYLGIILVIGAFLLIGNAPCFADAGAGVSITLETTVVGSSGEYYGGYGGGGSTYQEYFPPPLEDTNPVIPPIYIPPSPNTEIVPPPNPPSETNELPTKPWSFPEDNSAPNIINWWMIGAITLGIALFVTVIWYLRSRQRIQKVP